MLLIGAGVIGLSTGIRLLERGMPVTIVAREVPPWTTSNWAAAIWFPYKAYPLDRVLAWSRTTYNEFYRLMDDAPEAGVREMPLIELFRAPVDDPWWRAAVHDFRRARPDELPAGYVDGYVVNVPVIDTSLYLDYLMARFLTAGGTIEQRAIHSWQEVAESGPVIVNCAGLGARELAADAALHPIRGQVVRVQAPRVSRAYLDEEQPTYIIPRTNDVILGGTAEVDAWETAPDMTTAEEIIERCLAVEGGLLEMKILEHGVGLRPGRAAVRLEREEQAGLTIIHNYGHGGAGFTLSWGCAAEAADLVLRL